MSPSRCTYGLVLLILASVRADSSASRTPTRTVSATPTPSPEAPTPTPSPQPAWLAISAFHQTYPTPERDIIELKELSPTGGDAGQINGRLDIVGGRASIVWPQGFACSKALQECYILTQDRVGPQGPVAANIYTVDTIYGDLISSMQLPNVTAAAMFLQPGTHLPIVVNVTYQYAVNAGGASVLLVNPPDGEITTLVELSTDDVPPGYTVVGGGAAFCGITGEASAQDLFLQVLPANASAPEQDTTLLHIDLISGKVVSRLRLDWPRGFNALTLQGCDAENLAAGTGPTPSGIVYRPYNYSGSGNNWPQMAYGTLGPNKPWADFANTTNFFNTLSCGPPCVPSGFIQGDLLPASGAELAVTFSQGGNPGFLWYFMNTSATYPYAPPSSKIAWPLYGASVLLPDDSPGGRLSSNGHRRQARA